MKLRTNEVRPWLRRSLRAAWATRMFKLTVLLLLVAVVTRRPLWLLPAVLYYAVRAATLLLDRVLYSVRAKLAAFYLNAALLPFLLIVTILVFVGYLVLAHVSAQVVERRLGALADWAEQRSRLAETTYWQRRAQGETPAAAAAETFSIAFGDVEVEGFAAWIQDAAGNVLLSRGDLDAYQPLSPKWLDDVDFAGLASRRQRILELRTHTRFRDADGDLELGSALRLRNETLNMGLRGLDGSVHGDLGEHNRPLHWSTFRSMQQAIDEGVLAAYPAGAPAADSLASVQESIRRRIESRYKVLLWTYGGHPVVWETGQTQAIGPDIHIAFSIEGATAALLRTSFDAADVIWVGAIVIIAAIVLLQIVATVRGFLYARSISSSVAKIDRGVRAVREGDFEFRIQPRERDQLGALASAFNDMSQRLQALLEERSAHEVMERELSIAREVQQRLFPEQLPQASFLEASGICLPARLVSGDYYDFIPVRGGYDLVVADVSGKGMSAALLMASVQAALRSQYVANGQAPPAPQDVVTRLNRLLHANVEPTRFVTLFLVRYLGDGKIVYCNAGHNPALLVRKRQAEWLRSGGLMLGPFPDHVYRAEVVAAQPGDLLCLYTDGITEAMGPGNEQYGDDRLAQVVRDNAGLPLHKLQETIIASVNEWQGEGEASDDITLVLLRVREGSAQSEAVERTGA